MNIPRQIKRQLGNTQFFQLEANRSLPNSPFIKRTDVFFVAK
jgi:hypothetical protein